MPGLLASSWYLAFMGLLFGFLIGSFLNVLVLRWQTGLGFLGRSKCFSCDQTLAWYDLVPVFSFVFLRGRCRRCKSKISGQYPLLEALTGVLTAVILYFYGLQVLTLFLLLATWLLLAISFYDYQHFIIPDTWSLLLAVLGLVGQLLGFLPIEFGDFPKWLDLTAGLWFALPFFLLWLFSKGKLMGFGDIKLMVGVGLLLGFSLGLTAIILAFWIGAVVSLVWLFWAKTKKVKGVNMKSPLPFGPFLAIGTIITFIWPIDFLLFFVF